MINLNEKYILNAESGNPNRVYYIHIFYSETDFIPISNKTIFVDGREYYDCLLNTYGSNLKWNVLDDNKVTTSTPTIAINNFIFEDGISFLDFLYKNGHFIGNKCKIFLSFDGLSNSEALQLGEYTIQDVNLNNSNQIEISLNTEQLYDTYINGRKINSNKQTIGTSSLQEHYKIQDDANGITLPINFGNSKNHVLTQLCYKETENTEFAGVYEKGNLYYVHHDKDWWNKLKNNPGMVGQYQYNFNKNSQLITVPDNSMLVAIHEQDWYDYNKLNWELNVFDEFGGSSIVFYSGSNSLGNDNSMFVISPLRFTMNTASLYTKSTNGSFITSSMLTLHNIFNNGGDYTHLLKATYSHGGSYFQSKIYVSIDANLDVNYNIRTNKYGVINKKLKHSIVDGVDSYILGYTPEDDYYNTKLTETMAEFDNYLGHCYKEGFNELIHTFQNNYIPSVTLDGGFPIDFFNIRSAITVPKNYLGTTFFTLYNQNTKAFITKYATGSMNFTTWENLPGTSPTPDSELHWLNEKQANAYDGTIGKVTRDGLDKNIRCLFEFYACVENNTSTDNYSATRINEISYANTSRISDAMSPKEYLGYAGQGVMIESGSILTSAPSHTSNYYLKRNYEYLEAVLRAKSPNIEIGSSFVKLPEIFESHFSSSRDYSGTSIYKEIKLNDWANELIKYEPFTIFKDSTNKYEVVGMNKQYNSGSYSYEEIDYNETNQFNMYFGDSKKVYTELTTTTGYVPQLDSYEYKIHYKINPQQYDYSYWRLGNTYDNNSLIAPEIEKSTTGQIEESVSRVMHNGIAYGCIKSNINKEPSVIKPFEIISGSYWLPIVDGFDTYYSTSSLQSWNSTSQYYGPDIENYMISKYTLNLMANRKVMINFTTSNLKYSNLELGDLIEFRNVPGTLLGNNINGFNNSTNYSVSINGQTHYSCFIITSIKKDYKNITIECMQLVDLNAYDLIDMEDVIE